MSRLRRIIFIALLVAQGVIIGLIENMIPYPFAFAPGAKLGLANLITIIALFTMPKRESFMLLWMRLILTTLLGGTISTFLYSMSGALLSYGGMLLVKQSGQNASVSLVSVQLGDLCIMLDNWSLLHGLPNHGRLCFICQSFRF